MRPKVIDLFCGAGGLSLGFEWAGFDVVLGIDNFGDALKTFSFNHKNAISWNRDIRKVKGKEILDALGLHKGDIDAVIGGPPCQGFSFAGRRDPKDERNNLVWHFLRIVKEIEPIAFVMENVKGILSMKTPDGYLVTEQIIKRATEIGYTVKFKLLNSVWYGVPQKRERAFFIGLKEGSLNEITFPQPTHRDPKQLSLINNLRSYVTVRDAISDLPEPLPEEPQDYSKEPFTEYQKFMRKGSKKLFNHIPTNHKKDMIEKMKKQEPGKPLYEKFAHSWVKLKWNEPSPTVKENHNAPFVHPTSPRVVTPRECARLQSFPDTFIFQGTKSSQLVQIGNAVPPLLAKAIGTYVKEMLK